MYGSLVLLSRIISLDGYWCQDVVIQGNPRVYKALRDQLAAVLDELQRVESDNTVNTGLLDTINMIAAIMGSMKEKSNEQ